MAAAALTPRVRIMALCDGIRESKIENGVYHLKGVRQGALAHTFPFVPARLWLFVLLSSPRGGTFPGYIRVLNEQTDRIIFHGHLEPRPHFEADGGLWAISYRIPCRFSEPGNYTVQIWFFQEQGSDVLKGEMPFAVVPGDIEP